MDASIHVYTYRAGWLGKLGHDLKLSVMRFEVMTHQGQVHGRFDASSFRVDGAVAEGALVPEELSAGDRDRIQSTLARRVLDTRKHPEARFVGRVTSRIAPFQVEGTLYLHGEARPLSLTLRKEERRLRGETEITPSRWGIKPYRGLAGAVGVADRIRIEVDVPAGELATMPLNGHPLHWKR